MTPERLAEIQAAAARWKRAALAELTPTNVFGHRAELLAEVDRLTLENQRLQNDLQNAIARAGGL